MKPLGAGGMGYVYLGHDLLLDRPVAIKFIGASDPDERRRERFLFEGRALARLSHPNVVSTFRVGDVEGRPFLVSEYVSGESLDQLVGSLPWRRVLDIGIGLARGLAAAHRAGVLHRDVKPANVVLTADGTVKLIDFGLAKLMAADDPMLPAELAAASPADRATAVTESEGDTPRQVALATTERPLGDDLSRPGSVIGTRRYMAPERLAGQPASRQSDVFSLACVLRELCWGTLPGDSTDVGDAPDRRPPIPPDFQAILVRCLARDPVRRYPTADALLEALEALAEDTSASGEIPTGNPYRGLEAFDAAHRAVFLGRSAEVRAIVEMLRGEPVVVIAGDSGVGKSSLARAGVLPWITESGLHAGRGAVVASVIPGRDPLARLAEALGDLLHEPAAATRPRMLEEPAELVRALARAAGERTILIFVDQIEELFTQAPVADAAQFAAVLAALARAGNQLRVLATVRGDFLGRLAALPELGPEVARAPYLLRPLGPDKLREVIVGPARRAGGSFAAPDTVDELLRSALSSEGSLPLLQFTLAELWEARDPATGVIPADSLAALGGIDGALERHADRVIAALAPPQRTVARHLLARLVSSQRTRAALTQAELGELPSDDRATLEALITGRLVTVRGSDDGAIYELAHEALIARWSTLRQWLDEDAAEHHARQRLAAAAADWERLGRRGDSLWRGRQLAGVASLDASWTARLAPLERAFLDASRAARRRARALRIAVPILAALSVAVAVVAVRLRARAELAAAVDGKVAVGRRDAAAARRHDVDAQGLRGEAFRRFDEANGLLPGGARETSWRDAEAIWARVLAAEAAAAPLYARASSGLEAALLIDPSRRDTRDELAELVATRLAFARRTRQRDLESELAERLSGLVEAGAAHPAQESAPAVLSVHLDPANAAAAIAQYHSDAEGRLTLGPSRPLPRPEATVEPGSYLISVAAPGRAAARYPVLVAHGDRKRVELVLPPAAAVPPGFVFVPAGESLIGSDEEIMRKGFNVPPLHPASLPSFLIGRFEITLADYIAWLETLPSRELARRIPFNRALPGSIELRRDDHGWTLALRPTTELQVAAWGEPVRYRGRAQHAVQDWRKFPVTGVSFDDALAFARWLDRSGKVPGARMCREEEWERASRGADGRAYTNGRTLLASEANFDLTYGQRDATFGPDEVGSHPESASPFGVEDLEGNAEELVASGRWKDPVTMRGGSWYKDRVTQRLDNRFDTIATTRHVLMGFRVCADPATR